jgi:hypothetical protein
LLVMPVVHARRALGLALLSALAATGCTGGGGEPGPSPTTPAKVGLGEAPTPIANTTRKVTEANFLAPSGNIGCYLAVDSARCDIIKRQWTAPPKPADCELDWGNGISIYRAESATFTCAGDTVLGAKDMLPYGQSVRSGDFVCDSTVALIRCSNLSSGHGFTLSVQQYTTF